MELRKKSEENKGSVTLEAAVALPVFLFIILGMIFLMRIVFIHGTMQHALNETSEMLSNYSYLYCMTIKGQDEKIENYLNDTGTNLKKRINEVIEGYSVISGLKEKSQEELNEIIDLIINGKYKNAKSSTLIPLIQIMVGSQFRNENSSEDKVLKRLNVVDGIKGLDFSESNILEDNKNIEIIVKYKIKSSFILPEICIIQRSFARAWMEGDKESNLEDFRSENTYVWDMEQMKRGREIQNREGRNLPEFFPVIAIFKNGKAISVKSIDVEAITYKKQENLEAKIWGYIEELNEFKNGTYMDREIKIKTKELIVVIPEGTLKEEVAATVDRCKKIALNYGINLNVKDCYGKKTKNEDDNKIE